MPGIQTCNFCDLFGFNSRMNPVGRLKLRIGHDVYPPGFEFKDGSGCTLNILEHLGDVATVYFDEYEPDVLVLHMFVPHGVSDRIFLNSTPENAIYRYSKLSHLKDAYDKGHFLISPALEFLKKEYDEARQDNEVVHKRDESADSVKITTGKGIITPQGDVTFSTIDLRVDAYILCFSYDYDERLYDEFKGSDACLIINNVKEFADRIHAVFEKLMPSHFGTDGRVAYGKHKSPLGVLFSKSKRYIFQREYRFAWTCTNSVRRLDLEDFIHNNIDAIRAGIPPPVDVYVGPLKDISILLQKS